MVIKGDYILPNHMLFLDFVYQSEREKTELEGSQNESLKTPRDADKSTANEMFTIFDTKKIEPDTEEYGLLLEEIKENNLDPIDEVRQGEPKHSIFVDKGPVIKVLERRNYQKHLFPYNTWKTYELKGLRK